MMTETGGRQANLRRGNGRKANALLSLRGVESPRPGEVCKPSHRAWSPMCTLALSPGGRNPTSAEWHAPALSVGDGGCAKAEPVQTAGRRGGAVCLAAQGTCGARGTQQNANMTVCMSPSRAFPLPPRAQGIWSPLWASMHPPFCHTPPPVPQNAS